PTIGSHWWSRWPSGGLNRFYVSDTLTVESPAGSFLSYKCDVTDSITGENIGTWFMAENVGMLKVDQVFEGDTFVLILQYYNIEGGDGVLPLEVGNQWRMVWEGYTGVDGFSGVDRPTEITLNQNYPNPFNAQTTISFNLTDPGPVKLEIYNLLGQKVETLIDEFYRRGPHTVNWDAVSQSSSTYFYKLTTGSEKSTRQMTLLK
ncbi:MAG: T9SS type A sorting domain-containing protein, partial [candidate division Zixibacteria bacterium]|nr:T9SS type A sorting domain-containing protein [candidate division Zixibacteria bacterium]